MYGINPPNKKKKSTKKPTKKPNRVGIPTSPPNSMGKIKKGKKSNNSGFGVSKPGFGVSKPKKKMKKV